MNNPDQVETIVDAALNLSLDQRAAYLDEACGGDASLRQLVEGLLLAHQKAPGLPTPSDSARAEAHPVNLRSEKVGGMIGRYKLLQQLGEGGCGVVYLAEQEEPVRRKVALKIIKLGMDTRQVIARFEAERQALALMDHPNIAKVHDGGATESGRPYFVMELVRGVRITNYCDENNLPTEKRLDLFIQVCNAIQHAHQKGIIHRDIKPSNILVTLHDGVPMPKVIDFGIAKATEQRLTDKTLFTALEQFIGTPAYMSPEQAEMSGLDIDTRSDVYSLGVLLYELLTGMTPFEAKDMAKAGLDEMRRIIREKEPVRPSTRISALPAAAQTTVARRRQMEARRLVYQVRGDLDWIVMKCLEKDRTRRYQTANGLGRDAERYLKHEPVLASPPSHSYRLKKLFQRNKLLFFAGAAVATALVAATAVSSWMFLKEKQARARAVQSNAQAEAVMTFLQDNVLAATRPEGQEGGLGHDVTVRAALVAAEPQIAQLFRTQPIAEARIRETLGKTFMSLSEYSNSVPQFHRAMELAQRELGPDSELALSCMNDLATALFESGRYSEGMPLLQKAYERMNVVLGPNADTTLETKGNLAGAYASEGKFEQALTLYGETARQWETNYGARDRRSIIALSDYGSTLSSAGQLREGVAALERSLTNSQAVLGSDNPISLNVMQNLADCYRNLGRAGDALRLHTNALQLAGLRYGSNHDVTLKIVNNIGSDYLASDRPSEALPWFQQAVVGYTAQFGETNRTSFTMMNNLATAYSGTGNLDASVKLLEKLIRIYKENQFPVDVIVLHNLALAYYDLGRTRQSLEMFDEALREARKQLGDDHPDTLIVMQGYATTSQLAGQLAKAIDLFESALKLQNAKLSPEHRDTLDTMMGLAGAYLETNRFTDAGVLLEAVRAAQRKQPGTSSGDVLLNLGLCVKCALSQTNYSEAEHLAREGLDLLAKNSTTNWQIFEFQSLLGASLSGQGKTVPAEKLLSGACAGLTAQADKISLKRWRIINEAFQRLAEFYRANSRADEARECERRSAELEKKARAASEGK